MVNEIWKDIKGYEGKYKISNLGRVFSIKSNKIMKNQIDTNHYSFVDLRNNGIRKHCSIHRLVALAFIPNPDNLPEVNHKDENKQNNCVTNLEWCTKLYNNRYGTKGLRTSEKNKGKNGFWYGKTGKLNPVSKPVLCLNNGTVYDSISLASKSLNIASTNIIKCCKGITKSSKGLRFIYIKK